MVATRVHQRTWQPLRDVPVAGAVEVIWCKRRWVCIEAGCPKRTFAESTAQVPPRARSTVRLRAALVAASARGQGVLDEPVFDLSFANLEAAILGRLVYIKALPDEAFVGAPYTA